MKLICKDNSGHESELTVGKKYEYISTIMHFGFNFYCIINDNNIKDEYIASRFITISEVRSDKLDKILGV